MTINTVTSTTLNTDRLVSMRSEMDELNRQMGTGLKSDSYAGLGDDRSTSMATRAELTAIESYQQTIERTEVTVSIMSTTVERIDALGSEVKNNTSNDQFTLQDGSRTTSQVSAEARLDETVALLNTDVNGDYLFSGLSTDVQPVAPTDEILYGNATQAGFDQVANERREADLGGTLDDPTLAGRLDLDVTAATVSITENGNDQYGFQLDTAAGASSSSPNIAVTGPTGTPEALTFDVTGPVTEGEDIIFTLQMPDGTSTDIRLEATEGTRADGDRTFEIGATPDETAANINAAIGDIVDELARTELAAASAIQAGHDFFDNDPPLRVTPDPVDGFAGATAPPAGDPTNTVRWYRGEDGPVDARDTNTARIDEGVVVSYGARANEDAFRTVVRETAVYATMDYSADDPSSSERYTAMAARTRDNLDDDSGQTLPRSVSVELASAVTVMDATDGRHESTKSMLYQLYDSTDGVNDEEVAAMLLSLDTQLQASYSITAILSELSLVNFIR
ncbi:MAG: hypothetical protein KI785_09170 [Devosiaceae bacterium]|nr:hypothetical protein [Devosiaceae bacterium MH13]